MTEIANISPFPAAEALRKTEMERKAALDKAREDMERNRSVSFACFSFCLYVFVHISLVFCTFYSSVYLYCRKRQRSHSLHNKRPCANLKPKRSKSLTKRRLARKRNWRYRQSYPQLIHNISPSFRRTTPKLPSKPNRRKSASLRRRRSVSWLRRKLRRKLMLLKHRSVVFFVLLSVMTVF